MLVCGFAFFAIPIGIIHITAGRILLLAFLFMFLCRFLLHDARIRIHIRVSWYLLFFAVWFLWAVVSLFWAPFSINLARHLEALIIGPLLIIFTLLFFSDEGGIRSLYRLWVVSAIIFIGIGVGELATGLHFGVPQQYDELGINHPRAVFWGPQTFGVFLSLAFPFLYIMVRFSKSVPAKVLGLAAIFLSFFFMVRGEAGGPIVAVAIGTCLILLLMGWGDRFRLIAVGLVTAGALALASFSTPLISQSSVVQLAKGLPQQILSINQPYSKFNPETSITYRQRLIKDGMVLLAESHYLGVGPGGFEYYMTSGSRRFALGVDVNLHNWWAEILVDYGVLIFALFVAFYIGLLWKLFLISSRGDNQTLRAVALATLISLVVFSISNVSASGLMRAYFVWLLFATALTVINYDRLRKIPEKFSRGDR